MGDSTTVIHRKIYDHIRLSVVHPLCRSCGLMLQKRAWPSTVILPLHDNLDWWDHSIMLPHTLPSPLNTLPISLSWSGIPSSTLRTHQILPAYSQTIPSSRLPLLQYARLRLKTSRPLHRDLQQLLGDSSVAPSVVHTPYGGLSLLHWLISWTSILSSFCHTKNWVCFKL